MRASVSASPTRLLSIEPAMWSVMASGLDTESLCRDVPLQNARFDSETHEVGPSLEPGFFGNPCPVRCDCLDTDSKSIGDRLVRMSFGQELEHLLFSLTQSRCGTRP